MGMIEDQENALNTAWAFIIEQALQIVKADSLIEELEADLENVKDLIDGLQAKIENFHQRI